MVRRMKLLVAVMLFGAGAVFMACSTIMHGTKQNVPIASSPTGATVTVNGQQVATTPARIELKRKDKHTIRISMEGYEPYEIMTTRAVSGWVVGNILFGGIIGLIVDLATGGIYNVRPDVISGELARVDASFAMLQEDGLYVVLVKKADPTWQRIGTLRPIRKR